MARGLAPVGSRSGPLHFFSHIADAGLATASQPNGGKPPHRSCYRRATRSSGLTAFTSLPILAPVTTHS
ncbi:hypothetical protein F6R97_01380 [Pseudomonas sp. JV414]|nr:hypothetical protein [Pseudomonas sp. JV414]